MTARRAILAILAAILLGFAALFFLRQKASVPTTADRSPPAAATAAVSPLPTQVENHQSKSESPGDEHSPIADQLNAPGGTIRHDVEILNEVFAAWQTNFPHDGNPVGENVEITAALTGNNPLHFAFISKSHPAINTRGELCDRWGTPFFFHALSGTQMQIRSAGPDKKMWTDDDVVRSP